MRLHAFVSGLLTLAAVAAQSPLPSAIQAVAARTSVTANSGLEAARDGIGLRGVGQRYRASFRGGGMRFEPALGASAPTTQHLALRPVGVKRGATMVGEPRATTPTQVERTAVYEHAPGLTERYDVRPDGVELSWVFAQRPEGEGDLVVRYAVDTSLPAPQVANGGLEFVHEGLGGVRIGDVTGVDAAGRTADGDVRWIDGGLELSLPAAFVATAAYPLVLDPVIGGVINVSSGLTYEDGEPDAAYDEWTMRFLVVWRRTMSATDVDVRGQLLDDAGALAGGMIVFSGSGVASRPRVATLSTASEFGVVWTQQLGPVSTVELEIRHSFTGYFTASTNVAQSTTSQFKDADIGAQTDASTIGRGFVVVYEDDDLDAIRARRYWLTAGQLASASAFSVFTDTALGSTYTQPAIARTASTDGKLLVVARRDTVLVAGVAIDCAVVDAGSNSVGPSVDVASTTTEDLQHPDVDGYASRWVVAWERLVSGPTFYDQVRFAPVSYDGASLTVGASSSFGGSLTSRAYSPTVGYALARTWIGYRNVTLLPTSTTTLRAAAVDSNTCTNCADTFTVGSPDGSRIVVATKTSGGAPNAEEALCVYHDSVDDVNAQRLRHYGTSGSVQNLGGGCGTTGQTTLSHSPGIGSSGFQCRLLGVSATALAVIFNFSGPAATLPCGPCAWLPFSVTVSPAIIGGDARVEFPIPCLPALVGSQFDTQWTTIDFAQAPCPVFPGLALSDRLRLTIGQ